MLLVFGAWGDILRLTQRPVFVCCASLWKASIDWSYKIDFHVDWILFQMCFAQWKIN